MTYGTPEYWQRQAESLERRCASQQRQLDDAYAAIRRGDPNPLKTADAVTAEIDRLHAELGDAMRDALVTFFQEAELVQHKYAADPQGGLENVWRFLKQLNTRWQKQRRDAYDKARAIVAANEARADRALDATNEARP